MWLIRSGHTSLTIILGRETCETGLTETDMGWQDQGIGLDTFKTLRDSKSWCYFVNRKARTERPHPEIHLNDGLTISLQIKLQLIRNKERCKIQERWRKLMRNKEIHKTQDTEKM